MRFRASARPLVFAALETVLITLTVVVVTYVRWPDDFVQIFWHEYGVPKALLLTAVTQICLYYADLYDLRIASDQRELFIRILQALGSAALILAAIYYWFPATVVGRAVFAYSAIIIISLVVGWRLLFDFADRRMAPRERLLIVGTNAPALTLARELYERRQELGVGIVGFVDTDPAKVGQPVINPGVIGTIADIPAIVADGGVDRVVVSLTDARGKLPMDRLLEMKLHRGLVFTHLANVYEEYTGKIAVENLRPSWLIFSEGFRSTRLSQTIKRAADITLAGAGLLLAAPVMAVIALLVRLTSPGPALYHQRRVGRHDRIFTVHKFRSMRQDAEQGTGAVWAQKNDSRLTPIGGFLRRSRLDELPQLWNVLVGDMSLVGPRPERPEFVANLTKEIPFYGLRHAVRPGVTGWAQIRYTYGASVEDALEKLQYDLYYIKHATLTFDLFILLSTIKTVVRRQGGQ